MAFPGAEPDGFATGGRGTAAIPYYCIWSN